MTYAISFCSITKQLHHIHYTGKAGGALYQTLQPETEVPSSQQDWEKEVYINSLFLITCSTCVTTLCILEVYEGKNKNKIPSLLFLNCKLKYLRDSIFLKLLLSNVSIL